MSDLAFMKLNGERFRLLSLVLRNYRDIADTLQLQQYQKDSIEHHSYDVRIAEVFKHWDQNASNYANSRYPHSWKGLWDLLRDSGLSHIGKEFFDFLNKHS